MITKGVYSATCSILNDDYSLNVDATIKHAASSIENGLHGCFFLGSTSCAHLLSLREKKELISKVANHKLRKQFFFGIGCNSLNDSIDLIKYGMEFSNTVFLLMPSSYYPNINESGVYNYYKHIILQIPKVKIILYNFVLKITKYDYFNVDTRCYTARLCHFVLVQCCMLVKYLDAANLG